MQKHLAITQAAGELWVDNVVHAVALLLPGWAHLWTVTVSIVLVLSLAVAVCQAQLMP